MRQICGGGRIIGAHGKARQNAATTATARITIGTRTAARIGRIRASTIGYIVDRIVNTILRQQLLMHVRIRSGSDCRSCSHHLYLLLLIGQVLLLLLLLLLLENEAGGVGLRKLTQIVLIQLRELVHEAGRVWRMLWSTLRPEIGRLGQMGRRIKVGRILATIRRLGLWWRGRLKSACRPASRSVV